MTVCLGTSSGGASSAGSASDNAGGHLVELSHTTHPQWTVLEACYASCCAPVAFQPLIKDGRLYTDGCLLANYPMAQCRERYGHEPEFAQRTLGIYIRPPDPFAPDTYFVGPPDLMTYLTQIMQFVIHTSNRVHNETTMGIGTEKCRLPHTVSDIKDIETEKMTEINIDTSWYPYMELYKFIHSREDRKRMIEHGVAAAAANI